MTTLARLWEAARVEHAHAWKSRNDRAQFWSGKSKGAADCAWMKALRAESAYTGEGFCAAGSVQDLQKACEHINFKLVWEMAGRTGFPLSLVAWIISLYSGPRLLMLEGTIMAAPLWPARGGPAGCRFSDMSLRMSILSTST